MCHEASITVVGGAVLAISGPITYFTKQCYCVDWHDYGRGRDLLTYFIEPSLLWLACTDMGEFGPTAYSTEPALLCFGCMVMGDVGTITHVSE